MIRFFVLLGCVVGAVGLLGADELPTAPPALLQLIRDQAIHEELQLADDQTEKISAALPEIDGPWFRSRNLPAEQQRAEQQRLTKALEQELARILNPPQIERLKQLRCQALGTRMFVRDSVIKRLALTPQQRTALFAAFVATDQQSAEIQQQLRAGKLDGQAAADQVQQLKAQERETIVAQLTDDQKQQLAGILGKPFDFQRVQRIYPQAPELTTDGVRWVQGGPLRLTDLRGKVVAVHFYAHQCINCVRNLPHYQAWHEDFADQGLVVIGIQTPELPAERDFDRVVAAAKAAKIAYPVLLDAESSNWNQWSNTMWPTVYLIDKQGYLRRWWQGELNWQGATGEQELRSVIEKLLKEQSG